MIYIFYMFLVASMFAFHGLGQALFAVGNIFKHLAERTAERIDRRERPEQTPERRQLERENRGVFLDAGLN